MPWRVLTLLLTYAFTFGVLVVTGARLGDDRGHGNMFLLGLAGFTASSLLCGLAPNAPTLLVGRLTQGACGALMTPQTLQVIQRRFDGDARVRAVGLYGLVLSLGVLAGQLAGGVIVTVAGWSWALLVNVPAGLVLLVASYRALKTEPPGRGKPLDTPGVALLTGAMALILVPLLLGREQGWPVWVWPSLGAGVAGVVLFGRVERERSAPLLDLTVLPEVGRGLITVVGVMGSYAALLFSLTLHLQNELGFTPLEAGLAFAPYAAGFATLSLTWRRLPTLGPGRTARARRLRAAARDRRLVAAVGGPAGRRGRRARRGLRAGRGRDGRGRETRARARGQRAADHGRPAGQRGGDRDAGVALPRRRAAGGGRDRGGVRGRRCRGDTPSRAPRTCRDECERGVRLAHWRRKSR